MKQLESNAENKLPIRDSLHAMRREHRRKCHHHLEREEIQEELQHLRQQVSGTAGNQNIGNHLMKVIKYCSKICLKYV